jgi:dCTP deaminase
MFLSDVDIKKFIAEKAIEIEPPVLEKNFRQCGIRVHLSPIIYKFKGTNYPVDMRDTRIIGDQEAETRFYEEDDLRDYKAEKPYILGPGKMVLGRTIEKVKMPNYMVGFLDGRSTISRFGITNNITSSLVDNLDNEKPKTITLLISNCGGLNFVLYPNLPIGILLFSVLSSRTEIKSSGQYKDNQVLPNLTYAYENKIF